MSFNAAYNHGQAVDLHRYDKTDAYRISAMFPRQLPNWLRPLTLNQGDVSSNLTWRTKIDVR